MHVGHKGINWDAVPLGAKPDTHIALEFGVAPQVVQKARRRRGIARFESHSARMRTTINWDDVGLGAEPDRAIADRLGVSRRTVCSERNRRTIRPFVGVVLTQEGQACRSIYEAMYDACLHEAGITHEHERPVLDLPFVADFKIGDEYFEIAGMGRFAKYNAKVRKKKLAYQQRGIPVVWLSSEDVERRFAQCSLLLRFRALRACEECGRETHDLVKLCCRPCYTMRWHWDHAMQASCDQCHGVFAARGPAKFCSRSCYWRSLEMEWPSWADLELQIAQTSIAATARELGVKPSTLYMRLRRRTDRHRP